MLVMTDNLRPLEPFFIEFEQTYLYGDILLDSEKDNVASILFLHGSMPSENCEQFFLLRQVLMDLYDLSSCSFDFIGHGRTGGECCLDCIEWRSQQSMDIVDACFDSQPLNIVASGMAAATAIQLTKYTTVENLVLLAPTLQSQLLPSGEGKPISTLQLQQRKQSLHHAIQQFTGCLAIIAAEKNTDPLQDEMRQLYFGAKTAQKRWLTEITNGSQRFMSFLNQNPSVLLKVAQLIAESCEKPVLRPSLCCS